MLCQWCGGDAKPGTTCAKSVPCPKCGADAGKQCTRTSGTRAHQLHTLRFAFAEAMDRMPESGPKKHSIRISELIDAT